MTPASVRRHGMGCGRARISPWVSAGLANMRRASIAAVKVIVLAAAHPAGTWTS
jgi:hypothetical protein